MTLQDWLSIVYQWGIPAAVVTAVSKAFGAWRKGRVAARAAPELAIDKNLERATTMQALQDGLFDNQRQLLEAQTESRLAAERQVVELRSELARVKTDHARELDELRREIRDLRDQITAPRTETP